MGVSKHLHHSPGMLDSGKFEGLSNKDKFLRSTTMSTLLLWGGWASVGLGYFSSTLRTRSILRGELWYSLMRSWALLCLPELPDGFPCPPERWWPCSELPVEFLLLPLVLQSSCCFPCCFLIELWWCSELTSSPLLGCNGLWWNSEPSHLFFSLNCNGPGLG